MKGGGRSPGAEPMLPGGKGEEPFRIVLNLAPMPGTFAHGYGVTTFW
jgi:hypothetical protein